MSAWRPVKRRTAADGQVLCSADGTMFMRTGGPEIDAEARMMDRLAMLDYPVPAPIDRGVTADGRHFFTERSVGEFSLHDTALRDVARIGQVGADTIDMAIDVSARLLDAQVRHAGVQAPEAAGEWFRAASYCANVFAENPDLDTSDTRGLVEAMLGRVRELPLCVSHLDYGLPNAFVDGVIDWQHHGMAPVGYDVYPMLDIAAFKGGNRGYTFTSAQRARYAAELDDVSSRLLGYPLGRYRGDFLLVKCFFFLALMKPADPAARPDKQAKWLYRRSLFRQGLQQYASSHAIDTGAFPTLSAFDAGLNESAGPGS